VFFFEKKNPSDYTTTEGLGEKGFKETAAFEFNFLKNITP